MRHKNYFVYIVANERNGTIYTGVTGNLYKRIQEHKEEKFEGFTKKYNLKLLVYFETTENIESAIQKENQLKDWKRSWKIALIEKENPDWNDLSREFLDLDSLTGTVHLSLPSTDAQGLALGSLSRAHGSSPE